MQMERPLLALLPGSFCGRTEIDEEMLTGSLAPCWLPHRHQQQQSMFTALIHGPGSSSPSHSSATDRISSCAAMFYDVEPTGGVNSRPALLISGQDGHAAAETFLHVHISCHRRRPGRPSHTEAALRIALRLSVCPVQVIVTPRAILGQTGQRSRSASLTKLVHQTQHRWWQCSSVTALPVVIFCIVNCYFSVVKN